MPSLRRTLSAPSRSSPYSSSTQTRTSPRSPRRSSGSDTANRRVLADIDWWRVEEGQREVRGLSPDEQLRPATPASDEEEVDQEERAPSPVAATLFTAPSHNSGSSTDLPLWHNVPGAGWDTFDGFELPSSDIDSADPFEIPSTLSQFAALSLNPVGRATLHRSVSSSSAFSDMSFESDSSYSSPASVSASLTLGFEDFVASPADDSDDEYDVPEAILSRAPRLPSVATPTTTRSVSYSAVESELSSSRDLFSYFGGDDDDTDDWSSDGNSSNEDVFF